MMEAIFYNLQIFSPFFGGFPMLIYAVLKLSPTAAAYRTHTVIIGGPIKVATTWQTLPGWGSLHPEAPGLDVSRFHCRG